MVTKADGSVMSLREYAGRVLLIVNTASRCKFTGQYEGLERLQEKYEAAGLSVLAFPCNQFMNQEAGSNGEIQSFCKLQYNVTFPVFAKIEVNGSGAHPLFQLLTQEAGGWLGKAIKWNFTKFLVNRAGVVCGRYAPFTAPRSLEKDIESVLREKADSERF